MAGETVSSTQNQRLIELWNRVIEQVKVTVMSPTMWRALERTVPVVWEGDTFVVGFSSSDGGVSGQLGAYETRLAIERAVREVTGSPNVTYRLIEGDSLSDWEHAKARDAAVTVGQQQATVRVQKDNVAAGSWDEVYERIARLWSASEFRGQATGRARFLYVALGQVEEAVIKLYPDVLTKPVDAHERGLSRIIERIASYTSSDAAVVGALLFERLKSSLPQ